MGYAGNKKTIFFAEITAADNKHSKLFILSKYYMFSQSDESFSILCDVFFAKKRSFPSKTVVIKRG